MIVCCGEGEGEGRRSQEKKNIYIAPSLLSGFFATGQSSFMYSRLFRSQSIGTTGSYAGLLLSLLFFDHGHQQLRHVLPVLIPLLIIHIPPMLPCTLQLP